MTKQSTLSWDDLAEFYKNKTGASARIKSMDEVFDWAEKQSEIRLNEDGTLSFKLEGE